MSHFYVAKALSFILPKTAYPTLKDESKVKNDPLATILLSEIESQYESLLKNNGIDYKLK